ncbi:MAG: Holliday junction branch migration protein RuvA [Candidatus Latescibacteria bacterium]|nr:Holliday junction branch migration protein RuvA [Candidatus Latescibacterota bacterium]NIM66509.1 Holliday junction branch migration protein RuvA [Candidatus Latescibacterota bacterium]NIO02989.1 Holliday junction branch migration protein RuvA [Candidatus Latescibacterota bacterium]NIO30124.1 Holliday junction branch migration protein RuvA [Candidatus Latescibacterota bacterium]NIO57743.1 Holliday junction branch migration protein RuvA [Candidatus Latescibacterota bacterium]
MIAHLQGKLLSKEPICILDVGGIGYELHVPEKDAIELRVGDPDVSFHTFLYVREDRLTLFGFLRREERELFTRLIEVSGIGPKIALGMFGAHTGDRLVAAIKRGEVAFLKSLPGLGKKTAERLVMELGGKLEDFIEAPQEAAPSDDMREEVILALTSLGMTRLSAERAIEKINWKSQDSQDVEKMVREALKYAGSL